MRVVAGELRGRKLTAATSASIRPTTDKVREAIFGALTSLDALVGSTVADLYAGSGALGIEALSRGAAHCTFVERDRRALEAIRDNVARFGLTSRARIVPGDVIALLPTISCDVAFADPPYGFDDWDRLLAGLDASLLVAEGDSAVDAADGWEQTRVKRYGRTWVTFLRRSES